MASAWVLSFLYKFSRCQIIDKFRIYGSPPTHLFRFRAAQESRKSKPNWKGLQNKIGNRTPRFSSYVLRSCFLITGGFQGAHSPNASMDNRSCRFGWPDLSIPLCSPSESPNAPSYLLERGGICTKSFRAVGSLQLISILLPTDLLDNLVTNQNVFLFLNTIIYISS